MTYYLKEIIRIKNTCYSNQSQLNTVIATRHFINHNYDKELNLELLSRTSFTSKFHLLRLFKRYYGQTPGQYLINRRLEKSKEFLISGLNISGTCFNIGFESPGSFSTLFKSKFGKTPSNFQKEQFSQSQRRSDFEILQPRLKISKL